MRNVAIIDIDTTIANNDHRAVLLKRKCVDCGTEVGHEHRAVCTSCGCEKSHAPQSSWDQFLRPDLMLLDTPQPHARDVIEFMRHLNYQIVFMTGRNEKHREVTEQWLLQNGFWSDSKYWMANDSVPRYYEPVIMRPAEQTNVPASVMKEEQFLSFRQTCQFTDKFMFFEDDRHVLGTWRKYGMVYLCPEAWQFMNPEVKTSGEMAWNR